jgi:DNA-binding MarR family transcriptional regulator
MVQDGLLEYRSNPKHKRSSLVFLSEVGREAYTQLRSVQDPWAIESTTDIPIEDLDTALQVVRKLIQKFDR